MKKKFNPKNFSEMPTNYYYNIWTHFVAEGENYRYHDEQKSFPLNQKKEAFMFYQRLVNHFNSFLNSKTHKENMKQQKIDTVSITAMLCLVDKEPNPGEDGYFPIKSNDENVDCKQGLLLDAIVDYCN